MSIASRWIAALLLAAALALGGRALTLPQVRADHPEFKRLCGPVVGPLAGNLQWEGSAYAKLQEVFFVEGTNYAPETSRFTWLLRTKNAYPGDLAEAERKFGEALVAAFKETGFCAFYYDAEGRRVGLGELFFLTGERRPDNTFVVFADLNLHNADLIAVRGVLTLCERPKGEGPKLDGKNGKDDKKPPEKL